MSYGMYDNPPNFGFTASALPGLPTTLDQINPSYYHQIGEFIRQKGGRLSSITGITLYDTLRVDAPAMNGTLPGRDFIFFQTPVGQQQGLFISGAQYTKQEIDVHPWIVQGGQLATGYECLVWAIGVQFHIVSALDESVQTSGNSLNLTLDPGLQSEMANTDPVKMANLMRAYQESLYFEFFINQTSFESGPGWRFPAGCYGMSGATSIHQNLAMAADRIATDGFINNGFGWAYQMPVMRHLPSLTKFGVRMKVQNSFDNTALLPVRIVVTLEGIGVQPVTG